MPLRPRSALSSPIRIGPLSPPPVTRLRDDHEHADERRSGEGSLHRRHLQQRRLGWPVHAVSKEHGPHFFINDFDYAAIARAMGAGALDPTASKSCALRSRRPPTQTFPTSSTPGSVWPRTSGSQPPRWQASRARSRGVVPLSKPPPCPTTAGGVYRSVTQRRGDRKSPGKRPRKSTSGGPHGCGIARRESRLPSKCRRWLNSGGSQVRASSRTLSLLTAGVAIASIIGGCSSSAATPTTAAVATGTALSARPLPRPLPRPRPSTQLLMPAIRSTSAKLRR